LVEWSLDGAFVEAVLASSATVTGARCRMRTDIDVRFDPASVGET